jgi:hypothetical protein
VTDPLTLGVAAAALGLSLSAGWLMLPRAPRLDGERWFKVMLATVLLGEIEARGGKDAAWLEAVIRFVPYHPAGREPEGKVRGPATWRPPGAWLEGEQALMEALTAEPDAQARFKRMYDLDERGIEARTADPHDLGPEYDPGRLLGPGGGWSELMAWGAGDERFAEALRRKLPVTWALVPGHPDRPSGPDVLGAILGLLGDSTAPISWSGEDAEQAAVAVRDELQTLVPISANRVIVVAAADGVHVVLRALQGDPGLRDRVAAVVSVGGVVTGWPDDPGPFGADAVGTWMAQHYTQRELDTEVIRLTPYLALQWLDRAQVPPGALDGVPLQVRRFHEPDHARVERAVEPVDLGPLPVDPELPLERVAQALVAVVACWVLSRTQG